MSKRHLCPARLNVARPQACSIPRPDHGRCTASRYFHDYFTTHLPSSSLHPDSRSSSVGPNHHKLPRASSVPHTPGSTGRSPSALPSPTSRDTTVVRIPLRSAKHHFGASSVRGSRPYNEDAWQAGTIEVPAFARRQPISRSRRTRPGSAQDTSTAGSQDQKQVDGGARQGQSASGDPQVFYFGVFDGHGGEECSAFLKDRLHGYLEDGAEKFGLSSTLEQAAAGSKGSGADDDRQRVDKAVDLQHWLTTEWAKTVGGYFRRFKPEFFTALSKGEEPIDPAGLNAMLTFAFLNADLQFTQAQAHKSTDSSARTDDPVLDDKPINEHDLLSHPLKPASQNLTTLLQAPIGGTTRFKGGSTCSIALISTPTPMPFWNPASPSTLVAAHVGDTRILLCRVSDGLAVPLTSNHHPSTPVETARLRRYAASFVTDSFGEERILGLANTRAFGDIASKRMGVSAEPQVVTTELMPGEYSFLVLMSDGVSAVLDDQEVVDIVKEAKTPDTACRAVVDFATEVSSEDADNATCLVVRLGGWERRGEGGQGSLGTREKRDFRRREAETPRSRRH